jgi:hypothetical protein
MKQKAAEKDIKETYEKRMQDMKATFTQEIDKISGDI